MMKNESGFKNEQDIIGQGGGLQSGQKMPMPSQNAPSKPSPPISQPKSLKGGKGKVIPVKQEDLDLVGGGKGRKKLMSVLVVVLGIVFVLIISRSMGIGFGGGKDKPKTSNTESSKQTDGDSMPVINWKTPAMITEVVRDVTNKVTGRSDSGGRGESSEELTVTGIVVYNDNKKSAIIGDSIVKEGDSIEGVKIHRITKDTVTFEKDGKRWSATIE